MPNRITVDRNIATINPEVAGDPAAARIPPMSTPTPDPAAIVRTPDVTLGGTPSESEALLRSLHAHMLELTAKVDRIGDLLTIVARNQGVLADLTCFGATNILKDIEGLHEHVMHKLDGDSCLNDKECTNGTCGDSMPDEGTILDVTVRDTVRRWIAQGAKDN